MMMTANTNPSTGIRYGIISANNLADWVLDEIFSKGIDETWEEAKSEFEQELKTRVEAGELADEDCERELDRFAEDYYCDEQVYSFDIDGVTGRTTWLGGALLVWVFESPIITKARLCSPCVPNCGDLDNLDPENGYECYGVPADWLQNEEN